MRDAVNSPSPNAVNAIAILVPKARNRVSVRSCPSDGSPIPAPHAHRACCVLGRGGGGRVNRFSRMRSIHFGSENLSPKGVSRTKPSPTLVRCPSQQSYLRADAFTPNPAVAGNFFYEYFYYNINENKIRWNALVPRRLLLLRPLLLFNEFFLPAA